MWVAGYYLAVNTAAFLLYGWDKRKAIRHQYRISEKALLLMSFLGGGIGSLAGMHVFHHKTSKRKFRILVPLWTILHIALIASCFYLVFFHVCAYN